MTALTIRDATDPDWPAIWPILREVCAGGDVYTYARDISEPTARAIWMSPASTRVLVAETSDGAVVGSAKFGPNQGGPGSHVANASFIVSSTARNLGVGRALGVAVLDRAKATGFRAMQYNAVVETNAPAVKLWLSLGFEILCTVPEAFDHATLGPVGLHIMHRRLD
ncbi:MAG: GNAT family N-acetyltransferase [Brevundimonas sp.]|nr:MAG: GNAT family N-acetyltransferase [Brevundimonas sp.]